MSLCPLSGYDIRQLAQRSIGHFWSESYGQIYPTLKKLERDGLAKRRTEEKTGKPDRFVYSLTPKGLGELQQWLQMPIRREAPRNELLLKLFFGRRMPVAERAQHVERYRAAHQQLLQIYGQTERQLKKEHAQHPDLPFWLITLSYGRHRSQTCVDWCNETLAALRQIPKPNRDKNRKEKRG